MRRSASAIIVAVSSSSLLIQSFLVSSSSRRNGRYLALISASSSACEIARLLNGAVCCGKTPSTIDIARRMGSDILGDVERRKVVLKKKLTVFMEVGEMIPKLDTPLWVGLLCLYVPGVDNV